VLRATAAAGDHWRPSVDLVDPSGIPVHVVAGTHELPELPGQEPHIFNFDTTCGAPTPRNVPGVPARVQRLGHLVLQS
jgi:hypothetical protein